jgi:hypothetical protein
MYGKETHRSFVTSSKEIGVEVNAENTRYCSFCAFSISSSQNSTNKMHNIFPYIFIV